MFERKLLVTEDGSHSIYVEGLDEHYHSIHGALQESQHVFIKNGLNCCDKITLSILEIGFGTGLNALLTLLEAKKNEFIISYQTLEKYPLQANEYSELNFENSLGLQNSHILQELHNCIWGNDVQISQNFTLHKTQTDLEQWQPNKMYDLIYFDAFAPDKQPNLWTEAIFKKLFDAMNSNGFLSTYCAKGQVRRNMIAAGFSVARVPGPPGKREMMIARKS